MVSILPPHLLNKGLTLGNDLPPKPKFEKKNAQSDSVTFSLLPSHAFASSFMLCMFICFCLFVFSFVLHKNKNKNKLNN